MINAANLRNHNASNQNIVCVLDDDPQIGAVISRILVTTGFAPRQFSTPTPFLNEVKTTRPILVILDLALGQVDAIDIIRDLQSIKYRGRVLLISGRAAELLAEVEEIGKRHGLSMLPSLKKPFHIYDLSTTLKTLDRPSILPSEHERSIPQEVRSATKIEFKEALRNRWLEVWYQPKVNLKSLQVCGAEALLRLRHPQQGILSPISFLPCPGDPLHHPLAKLVLRQAIADWAGLAKHNLLLKLAVNMPVSVIRAPDFVGIVRTMLPKDGRFPGLIIELTEDEVITDTELIREIATQLRLCNVSLSIDDFGSGYAALSRLTDIPFSELKVDSKFVQNCSSNALQRRLCRTVVDLGHDFGALVCAEGVEQPADLRALIEMGCDMAQGFLFARPMPIEQLLKSMRSSAAKTAEAPQSA